MMKKDIEELKKEQPLKEKLTDDEKEVKEEETKIEKKKTPKKDNTINKTLNKRSNLKVYEIILFSVLIVIVSTFLTIVVIYESNKSKDDKGSISLRNSGKLNEIEEVYDLIEESYYKDVDKDKLVEGAINGMLGALDDPHTNYLNSVETNNFNEVMNGSYEGIGAEISLNKSGEVIVFSVFKNSPAQEAGLKFNDVILSVNDKSTKGLSTTEVVTLIKDKKHETAKIKVRRGEEELEFNVKKRVVVIESVESKVYDVQDKKIGYVVINTFANNTYDQFRKHIEDLEKEKIKGLVIDVRGNSGGYLHSVTSMLDMFLPKNTVIYQIADKKKTDKFTARTRESRDYPVAVLVDKASASASEILAVSMKESYKADVVGTYTYGKGTVQTTKDLKDGAMIKYTIQKWLSPKGNWIDGKGVKPTIEVKLSEEYAKNPVDENDNQLQTALSTVASK